MNIHLHGVVKSVGGNRIQTSFAPVPDVPVSKFTLTMQGGKKGLILVNSETSARKYFSKLVFLAQNGKRLRKKRLPLRVATPVAA